MLKFALFASALAVGAPAVAQDMTTPALAQQAPQAAQPAPMETAPTQTPEAAAPAQVAQVVQAEFPTYDKDANGSLDDPEFTAWMGALRKASEPTVDVASAEVQTWIDGAFNTADADKSKTVTQVELTTFLTAGQPG